MLADLTRAYCRQLYPALVAQASPQRTPVPSWCSRPRWISTPCRRRASPVSASDLMAEQQRLVDQLDAGRAHKAQGAALNADIARLTAERDRLRPELAACTDALAHTILARAPWAEFDHPSSPIFTHLLSGFGHSCGLRASG